MYFVGIDLAWGERNPTGLAVLDEGGRLVHVETVRTDEEIVAALAPYDGPVLVAFDAPLVVTNPTGNRPAEAALNRDFARFDAGAHPSNTGKPEFSDGTAGRPAQRAPQARPQPEVRAGAARDRGVPAPGHRGPVPARPHPEVQGQARPRPRGSSRRAAGADGPGRDSGRRDAGDGGRLARLVGPAERRGRGHPQVRAPGRRGPGRRRRGGVRRAVRRAGAGANHDLRRPCGRVRDRLHRHAHPAGGTGRVPS